MPKLTLNVEDLALETFDATAVHGRATSPAAENQMVPNTQQVKCTYFCNYPTGFC
ncbi:MAG TPA: hypothetical protein VFJ82_23560 [Longimicrobium sp.]|nr:hypothetical protein [Longimicrobium sp.]